MIEVERVEETHKHMTTQEAIKILKSKLDGHTDTSWEWCETVRMAIRSLESDRKIADVLYEIRNKITMLFIFDRESVVGIIDKYLKEVENESNRLPD